MFLLKVPNFWRCTLNYLQMTWYVTCDCKIKTEVDGGWIRRAGEALGLGCAVKTVVMSLEFCHKVAAASIPKQNPSTVGAISPARPRGGGHTPISGSRLLQRCGALLSQWTHIFGGGL